MNFSIFSKIKDDFKDECAFRSFEQKRQVVDSQKQGGSNFNRRTGKFEVGSVRFRKQRQNDLKNERDSYGRPVQKIAVLCGPPGKLDIRIVH